MLEAGGEELAEVLSRLGDAGDEGLGVILLGRRCGVAVPKREVSLYSTASIS